MNHFNLESFAFCRELRTLVFKSCYLFILFRNLTFILYFSLLRLESFLTAKISEFDTLGQKKELFHLKSTKLNHKYEMKRDISKNLMK